MDNLNTHGIASLYEQFLLAAEDYVVLEHLGGETAAVELGIADRAPRLSQEFYSIHSKCLFVTTPATSVTISALLVLPQSESEPLLLAIPDHRISG
jgi:hypothetical protein